MSNQKAETLKEACDRMRAELLTIEKQLRDLKTTPDVAGNGEAIAQSMLAVRHVEDARMRIGKVLQYALGGGVSVYDKPPGG